MSTGTKETSAEHAATLHAAVEEVQHRRPRVRMLRVAAQGKVEPAADEQRDCCRNIKWTTPGIGVRHLTSIRHIAQLYGLRHQELLNAVWEAEAEHMHADET